MFVKEPLINNKGLPSSASVAPLRGTTWLVNNCLDRYLSLQFNELWKSEMSEQFVYFLAFSPSHLTDADLSCSTEILLLLLVWSIYDTVAC